MSMVDTLPAGPYIPQEDEEFDDFRQSKRVLKSKENIFKSKHRKCLKKKLKKYKIRKDGKEDPDVLDVSHSFNQSLHLKSPNQSPKLKTKFEDVAFELEGFERPTNYLFKMVRRKQKILSEANGGEADKKMKSKTVKKNNKEEIFAEENIPASMSIQKKQKNAFQLLMDSRNKVIGSNSPGKDRDMVESESEEVIEKKKSKVKRNLALQKLAEAKGALKNREMEEQQEEIIKIKMEKRAERLKKMITKDKSKKNKKQKDKVAAIPLVTINDESSSDSKNKVESFKSNEVNGSKELATNNGELSYRRLDSQNNKVETSNKNVVTKKLGLKNGRLSMINDDTFSDFQNNKVEIGTPENNNATKNFGIVSRNLTEIDIFVSPEGKKTNKEDEEFLKKLSPSIKKKENMMCYFKKIEKEKDTVLLSDEHIDEDKETQPIKVKLTPRKRRKNKKRKLSLRKIDNNEDEVVNIIKTTKNDTISEIKIEKADEEVNLNGEKINRKRKRKHKVKSTDQCDKLDEEVHIPHTDSSLHSLEGRPKRNIKKPVKYVDDVQLTSSDEELHTFTPKKKKHADSKRKSEVTNNKDSSKNPKSINLKQKNNSNNKNKKLAPIFVAKPTVDVAALEAKQKFLQSGIPEQLKKIIAQQKTQDIISNNFYPVVHVQQIDSLEPSHNNALNLLYYVDSNLDEPVEANDTDIKKMLSIDEVKEVVNNTLPIKHSNIQATLQIIKHNYPEFPVYRTYKTLNSKSKGEQKHFNCIELDNSIEAINGVVDVRNEDPESLSWADKYKATSTKHMIGNFESIIDLKNWLQSWTENDINPKNDNADSDSDFYNSDADSRDARIANNLVIVSGPAGSGKTSSVYAVATELAMKVIEVNVSSKRTGRILLQDLQEATQSHKVNRGKGGENSQNSQELSVSKAQNQKKVVRQYTNKRLKVPLQKSESFSQSGQDDGRTGMSLILIDDADIVFDQDDGFISAIGQIVQSSKRPVILVTTSLSCHYLQRFLYCGNVIKMKPLLPRMLGTWLDIMCLADTGVCWPGTGAKFLDYFNGDMRKAINCLQFYVCSEIQKHMEKNPSDTCSQLNSNDIDIDDENSSLSWAGQYSEDYNEMSQKCTDLSQDVWEHFLGNPKNRLQLKYPLDLFNVWWSVPQILKVGEVKTENVKTTTKKTKILTELECVCSIYDSISLADCMSFNSRPDSKSDIFSHPWHNLESDSVSEKENMDNVDCNVEISNRISYELVKSSLQIANTSFKTPNNDIVFPGLMEQRKKDKLMSRHEVLTNSLNSNSLFDRRALALDYWSSCRTICRIEKGKTDNNTKRNNRFSHYLKSNRVTNDVFDKLCDSLKPSDVREE